MSEQKQKWQESAKIDFKIRGKGMIKVKNITRNKNWGIRPTDNGIMFGFIWLVERGEQYDLVQFTINGVKGYYWREKFCVPCEWTDEAVEKVVKQYVEDCISSEEVKLFAEFIKNIEEWGCE